MGKIRVVFADDHHIITDSIRTLLAGSEDILLEAIASDGEEALMMVRNLKPDILISDIAMPKMNGIELTSAIASLGLSTRVLILTMYTQEDIIFSVIQAGARGVISKQETTREALIAAIRKIYDGEEYFSPGISGTIMKSLVHQARTPSAKELSRIPCLTTREKEILKLYVEGFTNQEIADRLFISIRTVETHKNNIMQKFNFKSSVEMVKFALRNNLVSI
jgi:DNA-binding NarL/FixJ family response regulator